ncbi:hypothetical protein BKN38_00090 [Helicobacter sp. CLO-3]|uniref:hypothetical protein n=1 Tax=unclassified Helicobacter TaxID=2593540 RepID=UPI00080571CF|nr:MULTISPECIES: hypothetical protein [unclassified Helicobacter]OBV28775.1 hypothetical protein BA723_01490 [Helicobacter sp. CLO-3]OHU85845.1 hypothetical protein BKN38_00090 [Helicobacter sp. CLO-3]
MSQMHFSRIQKFIIRWKTRSLGADIDALILIVSVLVYMGRNEMTEQLEIAKQIINNRVKQTGMAHVVYERVEVEVAEYLSNEGLYIRARDRMFEEITHDIQLYGIALDMLQGEKNASKLQIVRSVVQKAYDEEYTINKESKRLLESQEISLKG